MINMTSEVAKKYNSSEKGKITKRKANKKYRQTYKELERQRHKKYRRTEKGKTTQKRADKKYKHTEKGRLRKAKRRNLGFNKLIENDWNCEIDWHHVNDNDVVPIPRNLHQMCQTSNSKKHREVCNRLINILYEGELKI